jgi:integrase
MPFLTASSHAVVRSPGTARFRGCAACACPPWTLHDLRRTFASGCAKLGIAVHVVEAALNHRSGSLRGIAAIYNRYSYDTEKRAAMAAWARHIQAIVSGETAANVVSIKSRS